MTALGMDSAGEFRERIRDRDRERDRRSPQGAPPGAGQAGVTGINGGGTSPVQGPAPPASSSLRRQSSRNNRMSNIESSVTRLLVATKQLIETLTAWSRRQASETDVSDVYVRLGNEFNIARTCFEKAGIEMTDLSDIPSQLRQVLETCLAREASPRVLEIYLPKVREIVINLLQGLKRKQARYRARSNDVPPPQTSPQIPEEPPTTTTRARTPRIPESPRPDRRSSPARKPVGARDSSVERSTRSPQLSLQPSQRTSTPEITTTAPSPRLPNEALTKQTNEALQKLQTSDALQRRASKRYSAYNFAKLDGIDAGTGGVVPPVPSRRSGSYSPEMGRSPPVNRSRQGSPEAVRARETGNDTQRALLTETAEGSVDTPEKIPVFLQLGSSTRRTFVSVIDLTLQSLRLLFVEKFQFNPGADTFPDILVTDRDTGVRYILEEGMQDITEGTVLTLDVELESGLKKTFNDGIQSLMKELTTLQENVLSQQSLLTVLTKQHATLKQDLTTHRHETIQKIQDIAIKSPTSPPPISPHSLRPALKSLKLDLSTLKSEQAQFQSHFQASLQEALHALPQVHITRDDLATQKTALESKTQALVTASDDLSDQVDDLRIDITQKRIRPHPRTITAVKKQNAVVADQIAAVETQLKALKPHWKRKWEEELQQVIDGQEFLRHQETLVADLRKDLSDTETVITQIIQAADLFESAAPREWLSGALGSGGRDALLGEVKTLQPNSAERIEAIKRAERQRLREMEFRRENDFQLELGEVVNEDKLRSQSQVAARLEAEREEKDRRIRREMWDGRPGQQPGRASSGSRETSASARPAEDGKRAVSEGFNGAGRSSEEESVVRSQSHSSGLLSRGRPVSRTELHRASTDSSRRSGLDD